MTRRVLLVGGEHPEVAICSEYFRLRLGDSGEIESIAYCDDALMAVSQQRFDLMLLLSVFARWRTLSPRAVRFGGIELLKRMRALDIQVPVLVVSASTLPEAKSEALASGAFGFVGKPLKLDELDDALRQACASG